MHLLWMLFSIINKNLIRSLIKICNLPRNYLILKAKMRKDDDNDDDSDVNDIDNNADNNNNNKIVITYRNLRKKIQKLSLSVTHID